MGLFPQNINKGLTANNFRMMDVEGLPVGCYIPYWDEYSGTWGFESIDCGGSGGSGSSGSSTDLPWDSHTGSNFPASGYDDTSDNPIFLGNGNNSGGSTSTSPPSSSNPGVSPDFGGDSGDLDDVNNNYTFQKNLSRLEDLIEENPFILMGDCPPETYQDWADLFGFQPTQQCYDRIFDLNNNVTLDEPFLSDLIDVAGLAFWELRPIYETDAFGAIVNMDYYSVTIDVMPTIDGQVMTPDDLVEYLRFNINDLTGKDFIPIFSDDTTIWNSNSPLTTLLTIPSIPPDGATVMCTDYCDEGCWTFTTVQTPINGPPYNSFHPVTGNRQFGLTQNDDGTLTVYTRAMDRATNYLHNLASGHILEGGEDFWDNLIVNIRGFITDNGGVVQTNTNDIIIHRPDYDFIQGILDNPAFPINSLGCDN